MNREIFTMPSAQDVPIDTVDAEEIELQESMKGVRNLIREMLLQEKTLADVTKLSGKQNLTPKELKSAGADLNYSDNKNITGQRRELKSLWNQHADHSYFQDPSKLFVRHYLGLYSENNELTDYFPREKTVPGNVPGIDFPNKDELSCFGTPVERSSPPAGTRGRAFFTFKKYRLTFAASTDAATERLSYATPAEIRRYKSSGLPKRPAAYMKLDQIPIDQEEVGENRVLEEVIIDNWVIDTFYCKPFDVEYAKELGLKYKMI